MAYADENPDYRKIQQKGLQQSSNVSQTYREYQQGRTNVDPMRREAQQGLVHIAPPRPEPKPSETELRAFAAERMNAIHPDVWRTAGPTGVLNLAASSIPTHQLPTLSYNMLHLQLAGIPIGTGLGLNLTPDPTKEALIRGRFRQLPQYAKDLVLASEHLKTVNELVAHYASLPTGYGNRLLGHVVTLPADLKEKAMAGDPESAQTLAAIFKLLPPNTEGHDGYYFHFQKSGLLAQVFDPVSILVNDEISGLEDLIAGTLSVPFQYAANALSSPGTGPFNYKASMPSLDEVWKRNVIGGTNQYGEVIPNLGRDINRSMGQNPDDPANAEANQVMQVLGDIVMTSVAGGVLKGIRLGNETVSAYRALIGASEDAKAAGFAGEAKALRGQANDVLNAVSPNISTKLGFLLTTKTPERLFASRAGLTLADEVSAAVRSGASALTLTRRYKNLPVGVADLLTKTNSPEEVTQVLIDAAKGQTGPGVKVLQARKAEIEAQLAAHEAALEAMTLPPHAQLAVNPTDAAVLSQNSVDTLLNERRLINLRLGTVPSITFEPIRTIPQTSALGRVMREATTTAFGRRMSMFLHGSVRLPIVSKVTDAELIKANDARDVMEAQINGLRDEMQLAQEAGNGNRAYQLAGLIKRAEPKLADLEDTVVKTEARVGHRRVRLAQASPTISRFWEDVHDRMIWDLSQPDPTIPADALAHNVRSVEAYLAHIGVDEVTRTRIGESLAAVGRASDKQAAFNRVMYDIENAGSSARRVDPRFRQKLANFYQAEEFERRKGLVSSVGDFGDASAAVSSPTIYDLASDGVTRLHMPAGPEDMRNFFFLPAYRDVVEATGYWRRILRTMRGTKGLVPRAGEAVGKVVGKVAPGTGASIAAGASHIRPTAALASAFDLTSRALTLSTQIWKNTIILGRAALHIGPFGQFQMRVIGEELVRSAAYDQISLFSNPSKYFSYVKKYADLKPWLSDDAERMLGQIVSDITKTTEQGTPHHYSFMNPGVNPGQEGAYKAMSTLYAKRSTNPLYSAVADVLAKTGDENAAVNLGTGFMRGDSALAESYRAVMGDTLERWRKTLERQAAQKGGVGKVGPPPLADTVIKDAAGEPLRVYHGTNQDFGAFNTGEDITRPTEEVPGAFFSDNPEGASHYAMEHHAGSPFDPATGSFREDYSSTEGAQVRPAYLDIRDPLKLQGMGLRIAPDDANRIAEAAQGVGIELDPKALTDEDALMGALGGGMQERAVLEAAGYDGLIRPEQFPNPGETGPDWLDHNAYIAFHPEQVISAAEHEVAMKAWRASEAVPKAVSMDEATRKYVERVVQETRQMTGDNRSLLRSLVSGHFVPADDGMAAELSQLASEKLLNRAAIDRLASLGEADPMEMDRLLITDVALDASYQARIAKGTVTQGMNVGTEEFGQHLQGMHSDFLSGREGWKPPPEVMGAGEETPSTTNTIRKWVDGAYHRWITSKDLKFARGPVFGQIYEREVARLEHLGWSQGLAENRARVYAAGATRDMMYDLSSRTATQTFFRNLFPFGAAWQEIGETWAWKIPRQMYPGLGHIYLIKRAKQVGDVFKLLGLDPSAKIFLPIGLMFGMSPVKQALGFYPSGANLLTQSPGPGLAPLPGIIVGQLAKHHVPVVEAISKALQPYGPDIQVGPSSLNRLWEATFHASPPWEAASKDYQDQLWAASVTDAMREYAVSHPVPKQGDYTIEVAGRPSGKGKTIRDPNAYDAALTDWTAAAHDWAESQAGKYALVRFLTSTLFPTNFTLTDDYKRSLAAMRTTLGPAYRRDPRDPRIDAAWVQWYKDHPGAELYTAPSTLDYHPDPAFTEEQRQDTAKYVAYLNKERTNGHLKTLDPQDFVKYGLYIASEHWHQYRQAMLLNKAGAGQASTQALVNTVNPAANLTPTQRAANILTNWATYEKAATEEATRWDSYRKMNYVAAAERDNYLDSLPKNKDYPVRSFDQQRALDTLKLLKELAPVVEAGGSKPAGWADAKGTLNTFLESQAVSYGAAKDPVTKVINDWFAAQAQPYFKQIGALFDKVDTLPSSEQGPIFDQIRKLQNADKGSDIGGVKMPSVQDWLWSAKSETEQRQATLKWATRPTEWLSSFSQEKLGLPQGHNAETFWKIVNDGQAWLKTQLATIHGTGSTQKQDDLKAAVQREFDQKAAGLGMTDAWKFAQAPPYKRIADLGVFAGDKTFQQVEGAVKFVWDTVKAKGFVPGGGSQLDVYYRTWLFGAIDDFRHAHPGGEFDRHMSELEQATAAAGKPLRVGPDMYQAVFFDQWFGAGL